MIRSDNPTSRNQIMDFLKGIGIIYVVLGHTLVNPMHNFIYLFHMPLFYFISGFFYNDDYSLKPGQLIISRIKTLYVPFLKYELFFLFSHNLLFMIYVYSDKVNYKGNIIKLYNFKDYLINFLQIVTFSNREQILGAFWFFTVLFSINVGFCIIRFILYKTIKSNVDIWSGIIVLILYVCGSILQFYNITLPRLMEVSFVSIVIFYLGFICKKYFARIPVRTSIAMISIVILIFGTMYATICLYNYIMVKIFTWIIFAVSGIYLNIYIAKFEILRNNRLIIFIGQNTIVIMALHFLCFKIVNLIQVLYYNYPIHMIATFPVINGANGWWLAYFAAGLFIPLFMKLIYSRIRQLIITLFAHI